MMTIVMQMCVLVGIKPTRRVFNDLMKTAPTTLYQSLSTIVPAAVPVSCGLSPCG